MREHNCHNCYRALYDEECPSPFVKSEECPDWEAYPESYIKRKEQEKKDIAKAQENCRTCIHKKYADLTTLMYHYISRYGLNVSISKRRIPMIRKDNLNG